MPQSLSETPGRNPVTTASPATRDRLIAAGIDLFGENGFEATSTRALARAANVNIAGIAYHFGGKEGLYHACARRIAERVTEHVGAPATEPPAGDPQAARNAIAAILSAIVRLIAATPEMETSARFILREHMDPTAALDILYDSLMGPLSDRICTLWSAITGADAHGETTRLIVLGLIGQIMIFRVARNAACRRLGWTDITERENAAIETMVLATLDALIAAYEGRKP